ncbi:MAG: AraC family transcriptional regulator ligand-binding domain-containing protein [Pseudomonadales bacterium]
MSEFFLPAYKYHQLFDYLSVLGCDAAEICAAAGVEYNALQDVDPTQGVPAEPYSKLYLRAAQYMETRFGTTPWGAGVGSMSFRLMCYTMISCGTLGEALNRAAEFCAFASQLNGHLIELTPVAGEPPMVQLAYQFNRQDANAAFAPPEWSRSEHYESIVLSSGLRVWASICGWLIGRTLQLEAVQVAAPSVNEKVQKILEANFVCPIEFGSKSSFMVLPASELQQKIVQDNESLENFLTHVQYQFWIENQSPSTTSNAIRSMISMVAGTELPQFDRIAERLGMSSSTLRRRLMEENTSYQKIKDDCRKSMAIDYLHQYDYKIHEIGDLLGFAETSSFVRSFKKWTGMTPKTYRDSSKAFSSAP